MKKNSFFFILFFVFLSFIFGSNAYSQNLNNLKGLEECEKTAEFLNSWNVEFTEQTLLYSEYNDYPFNIIIDFPENKNAKIQEGIKTVIFHAQIEDFFNHKDFFSRFLFRLKNAEKTVNVKFLFTTGNNQLSPEKTLVSGSKAFTEALEDEECCVICFNFTESTSFIVPAANRILSPTWIIRFLSDCFYENDFFYNLKGTFSVPLYKLNILQFDKNLSNFLTAGIPGCGIDLNDQNVSQVENFIKSIEMLVKDFDPSQTLTWDTHGLYLQAGNKLYILNESFTLIVLLFVACISLFILCEFSFISRQKHIQKIAKAVRSSWIQLPFAIILTTLALILGQGLGYLLLKLFKAGTVLRLILKMFLGLGMVGVIYFLTFKINKFFNTRALSYLLTISSLINVFIFSAVDISLVYIFAVEYIIVYLSRPFKTPGSLSLFFLMMVIPFFPYIFQAAAYADVKLVDNLLSGSIAVNFFLALIITPFEIQLLRIFVELNREFKKADTKTKNFYKQNIYAISGAFGICVLVVTVVLNILPKPARNTRKFEFYDFSEEQEQNLITWKDENYFDEIERILKINLPENPENLRIVITGSSKSSILYSDDPYYSDKSKKEDYFIIPAWPGKKLEFCYIPEVNEDSEIYIKGYFPEPDSVDYKYFEHRIKIPALNGKGK